MTTKDTAIENMKEIAKSSATNNKVVKHKGTLNAIRAFTTDEKVKERFAAALQKNPSAFLSSIISLVSSSTNFDGVDPNTIMMGAMQAATLDLPINPNLGFAHIVPYSGKAQFQLGWKGFIQLALRTGQYQTINVTEVYEGELISRNRLTGEIIIDENKKSSDTIIGYVAYFKLNNGFEKSLYMTVTELETHGKRYSQSYANPNGSWKTNKHAMMLKTPIKLLLSKYGILSVQMQQAIAADQAVVRENEDGEINYEYVDNDAGTESEEKEPTNGGTTEQYNDPQYWIGEILKLKTEKEVDDFEKGYGLELQAFGGNDAENIRKALLERLSEVRKAKIKK